MSTILLIALFVSLCLMQWFFSKNRISLLSFLPTEFYLLIAGIAAIRTIWTVPFRQKPASCFFLLCQFS